MYQSVCDAGHHHYGSNAVAEIQLVKSILSAKNDYSTLAKNELSLENNACKPEKGGEDTVIRHIQEDNSHSGKHKAEGELKTQRNRSFNVHTAWRGQ